MNKTEEIIVVSTLCIIIIILLVNYNRLLYRYLALQKASGFAMLEHWWRLQDMKEDINMKEWEEFSHFFENVELKKDTEEKHENTAAGSAPDS